MCGLLNLFIPLPTGTFSPSRKASERRLRLQPTMKFQLSIYYILIKKNNNIFRFPSSKRGLTTPPLKNVGTSHWASSEALPVTSGSILGPMTFLSYANLLPEVVQSSRVAAFADDPNFSKTIVTQEDSSPLQADLRNLVSWSSSGGLVFNESKCKVHRITRKLTPVTASCQLNEQVLGTSTAEKRPLTTSHGTDRFLRSVQRQERMI